MLTMASDAIGEREIARGDQIDIREIAALGDGELTDQNVAAYVAKYATKSAEDSDTVDHSRAVPTASDAATSAVRTASGTCATSATAPGSPSPSRTCACTATSAS
ncbi:hypothetical protein Shyhy02_31010 [Streptomyces hygroscopicus subsp. hygroscopicus]|nr:hypothetical protein Shyhy02_31010 [Streptomyces hygroscopicus subsp. hygroscopicus]